MNAQRPTRRWHKEQCRRDVSRALFPISLSRGVRMRTGVPPSCEILVRGEEGLGDGESARHWIDEDLDKDGEAGLDMVAIRESD